MQLVARAGDGAMRARRRLSVDYQELAKLVAADGAENDGFGVSVAIDGDTVVAGASRDDDGSSDSGSVYVLRTSDGGATYVEVAKLTASDAASGDWFGTSVAIDGGTIVVAAHNKNSGRGAVYVSVSYTHLTLPTKA